MFGTHKKAESVAMGLGGSLAWGHHRRQQGQ